MNSLWIFTLCPFHSEIIKSGDNVYYIEILKDYPPQNRLLWEGLFRNNSSWKIRTNSLLVSGVEHDGQTIEQRLEQNRICGAC